VPPKYSNRPAIIEVDRLSFAPLVGAATSVHRARRPHLDVQDLGPATTENLALRQQLAVLRRSSPKRLKLTPADRIFWVGLRRVWSDWKSARMIVQAETVVAWHRKGFRLFWKWRICRGKPGRPNLPQQVRDLIRLMSRLDHVIVFGERSLHRTLTAYCAYYQRWRTHLSLGKDVPLSRRIQPPAEGAVVELREVGGLHHHYERRAA
jgi:hypothetical protein